MQSFIVLSFLVFELAGGGGQNDPLLLSPCVTKNTLVLQGIKDTGTLNMRKSCFKESQTCIAVTTLDTGQIVEVRF